MIGKVPSAWLTRNVFNFSNQNWGVTMNEPTGYFDSKKPLYTINQALFSQGEYLEIIDLLGLGTERRYSGDVRELLNHIFGQKNKYPYMYKRLFGNKKRKNSEKQFELALLFCWPNPLQLIKVEKEKHWYVKYNSNKNNSAYKYFAFKTYEPLSDHEIKNGFSMDNRKSDASYFKTKEEAELWVTPYTEVSFEEEGKL